MAEGKQNFDISPEYLKNYKNKSFRIVNLKSEKGSLLNNKIAKVVGYDSQTFRLHMKLEKDETIYKIQLQNIINILPQKQTTKKPEYFQTSSMGRAIKTAKGGIQQVSNYYSDDRPDIKVRGQRLKQHLRNYQSKNFDHFLFCGDFDVQIKKGSYLEQLVKLKPECVGNGKFSISTLYTGNPDKAKAKQRCVEYARRGFCVACQIHYIENAKK